MPQRQQTSMVHEISGFFIEIKLVSQERDGMEETVHSEDPVYFFAQVSYLKLNFMALGVRMHLGMFRNVCHMTNCRS